MAACWFAAVPIRGLISSNASYHKLGESVYCRILTLMAWFFFIFCDYNAFVLLSPSQCS